VSSENSYLVPGTSVQIPGAAEGPLRDLTFMAKDLFDVAGHVTGAGNPDWARAHKPAGSHAWAVERLLQAGADLTGKTITDEISLGFFGQNAFYGTPLNPKMPDRVPGGSSSGSASAVAQGRCDVALGTDTGGSVRIPASFCGLYGLRPTHGRVPVQGLVPQAPTSDTIGWFARDAATMERVGAVMFAESPAAATHTEVILATDLFEACDPANAQALRSALDRLATRTGNIRQERLAPEGLAVWAQAQRNIQLAEAWETFRGWVDAENPRLAFMVARALQFGASVTEADLEAARRVREQVRARMAALLPRNVLLCLPTAPCVAPFKDEPVAEVDTVRDRINTMCCFGGLAGHPQLSIPLAEVDGGPVGLSIVGARGTDMSLVATAKAWEDHQ